MDAWKQSHSNVPKMLKLRAIALVREFVWKYCQMVCKFDVITLNKNIFCHVLENPITFAEVGEAIAQEQQEEEEIQIIEQAGNEVGATAQEEREEEVIWEEGMHIVATANNEVRLYLARGIEKKRTRKQVRCE